MFQTTTAAKSRISNTLNRSRNYYLFYLIAICIFFRKVYVPLSANKDILVKQI